MTTPPETPTLRDAPDPHRFTPRARLAAWGLLVAVLAVGIPAWFYGLRGERVVSRAAWLVNGWLVLGGACLAMWALLATTPADAIRLSPRAGKRVLLGVTSATAFVGLWLLAPLLSGEALRYRFDARMWLLGQSAGTTSPAEAAAVAAASRDPEFAPDALDRAAPHPSRTSLNGPVSQIGFVAAGALEYLLPAGEAGPSTNPMALAPAARRPWHAAVLDLPWWHRAFLWRCLTAAALVLTVGELIAWLRQRGRSVWWAALFAWQPLVLIETLGNGHQDVIGVLFLVAGLRRADVGRYRRAGLWLALAAAVKPLALLALPFVLRRAWRGDVTTPPGWTPEVDRSGRPRVVGPGGARRAAAWFVAAAVVLSLPLLADGSWRSVLSAAGEFAVEPSADPSVARVLERAFLGPGGAVRDSDRAERVRVATWAVCGTGVVAAGVIAWRRQVRPSAAFYATATVGLLLSPVSPPWMVVWPLAMVPMLGGGAGLTALVWAATAGLAYLPATASVPFSPARAAALQLAPVYLVGLAEAVIMMRRRQQETPPTAPVTAAR